METVTITAKIIEKKKVEFFQTMESLKSLVKGYCNDLDIETIDEYNVRIRITFSGKGEMEKNFYNTEFKILKGTLKGLCNNTTIKFN
jgi:hypothetical protein